MYPTPLKAILKSVSNKNHILVIAQTMFLCLFGLLLGSSLSAQSNVALNKSASQSSQYSNTSGQASKAVDGNTNGRWSNGSVTHTKGGQGQKNPWWTVDLGEVYEISKIQIWNRTDCCKNRLDNFRIRVKEGPRDTWSSFTSSNHRYRSDERYPLTFSNTKMARYVMVQLVNDNGILSLAEVKVFGKKRTTLPNADDGESINISLRYKRATKVGRLPNCPNGAIKDPIDGGTCWTCPSGYKRTVLSVKGNKACERPGGERFAKATRHGKGKGLLGTDCAGGQFWDPNGYCYSCPSGYNRTAHAVTSSKACSQKVHADYQPARKVGDYQCDRGFYDVGTQKCWTCPSGYKRTVFSVKGEKACEKIRIN